MSAVNPFSDLLTSLGFHIETYREADDYFFGILADWFYKMADEDAQATVSRMADGAFHLSVSVDMSESQSLGVREIHIVGCWRDVGVATDELPGQLRDALRKKLARTAL
jgi:hypothetical protein